MPIQGFTRFRYHQVGKQSVIGTAVPTTRVMPYRGPIVVNPNRTIPDVDTGSLDPILAPFAGAKNVTSTWNGPKTLAYNDLPYILAAAGKSGVTPSGGTAKTWTFTYASLTADDTNATNGIQAFGGVINDYTTGFGTDLDGFDLNANLIYAGANLCTAKTPGLTIDPSPTWIYGADAKFYVDTTPGNIGTTPWTDTVHSASWSWNSNLDQKRFANGSNTRFQLSGFGRGQRVIELTIQAAESAAAIAEACTLDDDPVPDRYIQMQVVTPVIITGSTPYSWTRRAKARLISVTSGEIGGNATMTFLYRVAYSSTLTYALQDVVVNTLTAL